jgi:pre-rRNA-processing protein IPI3
MEDIVISTSDHHEESLVYAWDLNTGTVLTTLKTVGCPRHAMDVIMYDQEHKQSIMVLTNGNMIYTYILGKNTVLGKYVAPPIGKADKDSEHQLTVMRFSSSMKWLYAASSNGKLWIWQLSTGNLLKCWEAHYRKINSILCIQDDYIITAGDDAFIHIWLLAE